MGGTPHVPGIMTARTVHGLKLHFDSAALAEYERSCAACDRVFSMARQAHGPMLERFGQPCPILLHGLAGCWRHAHDVKRHEHAFDLGDADRGICFHGSMHYEGHDDVDPAIVLINLPAVLLSETPMALLSQLSHAFCMGLSPMPTALRESEPDQRAEAPASPPLHEDGKVSAKEADAPESPPPPPRLASGDFVVPGFMRARSIGSLLLAFDESALAEYEEDHVAYDAIFGSSSEALRPMIEAMGQCPIWLHGLGGCWQYGHELKRRDHGFDLGDAHRGLAWHGNMHYPDHPEQADTIFLVNLPRAVLGHPTVLVHELTHHFHLTLGPERLPMISSAYARTCALRERLAARFCVSDNPQFERTFTNELEFFAYMMEAYHAKELRISTRSPGAPRLLPFAAPAFPKTRQEIADVDAEFGAGIADAIHQAIATIVAIGRPVNTS